ncbi:MAG: helix-turn-helix domain containing protein [Mogibacterium sp.]|nr:helix-turn-helix domain containing protein [Mogibacterium sp.]
MSCKSSAKILGTGREHVRRWVMRYEMHGPEGLLLHNGTYTGEFKQHVIEYMHEQKISASETAVVFKIPQDHQVLNWERIWRVRKISLVCLRQKCFTSTNSHLRSI